MNDKELIKLINVLRWKRRLYGNSDILHIPDSERDFRRLVLSAYERAFLFAAKGGSQEELAAEIEEFVARKLDKSVSLTGWAS